MNRIPPLQLPSLRAEVLSTGVILEPKKGQTLSEEDCRALTQWLVQVTPIEFSDGTALERVIKDHVAHGNRHLKEAIEAAALGPEPSHGFELYP